MKKYVYIVLSAFLSFCLVFSACSSAESKIAPTDAVKECLTSYFSYHEKGDFDNMKQYCRRNFVKEYFHEKDVFGNATAKLLDFDEIRYDEENNQYIAQLYVECVPVEGSALYDRDNPSGKVKTYIAFVLSVKNGKAIIEGLTE